MSSTARMLNLQLEDFFSCRDNSNTRSILIEIAALVHKGPFLKKKKRKRFTWDIFAAH